MRRGLCFLLALLALPLFSVAAPAQGLDFGRYGDAKLALPVGEPRGYVVLFSDAGGWSAADDARLAAIARAGAIALGVDTDAYLDRAARQDPRCLQLVGDAENVARAVERAHPGAQYLFPILVGAGKGGAVVGEVLAQAPAATLAGGVSLDPTAGVENLPRAFCPRVSSSGDAEGAKSSGALPLKTFWTIALSPDVAADTRAHLLALAQLTTLMSVEELDRNAGPDFLASLIVPHLARAPAADLSGLPLVELKAASPSRTLIIFYSGDGGWRDLDRTIGQDLQGLGVNVVGWDSVRYFWRRKAPDEAARDLAAVIEAYGERWAADRIALVGFSFGADVLPFLYDRLPQALRDRVALVTLLSPSRAADWEIHVSGWFGGGPGADATPLAPALAGLPARKLQCVYGNADKEAYCAGLAGSGAEVIEKTGGHHFDGDYALIAGQILSALNRRIQGRDDTPSPSRRSRSPA